MDQPLVVVGVVSAAAPSVAVDLVTVSQAEIVPSYPSEWPIALAVCFVRVESAVQHSSRQGIRRIGKFLMTLVHTKRKLYKWLVTSRPCWANETRRGK